MGASKEDSNQRRTGALNGPSGSESALVSASVANPLILRVCRGYPEIAVFWIVAIQIAVRRYIGCVSPPGKRKTSFQIDPAKVAAAKEALGTRTLTETVDVALAEVIKSRQRQTLVELLFRPGALELDDPDVMSDAWR